MPVLVMLFYVILAFMSFFVAYLNTTASLGFHY